MREELQDTSYIASNTYTSSLNDCCVYTLGFVGIVSTGILLYGAGAFDWS